MTRPLHVAQAVAGLVLIASLANAQATADQLARCAAIRTSAPRLQCYDALAKPKPAPSETPHGPDKVARKAAADSTIAPLSSDVFTEAVVDERPEILASSSLVYPAVLREAGVQGRVVVQAVVDTLGRAEPASIRVIQSPNPGFDQEATTFVRHLLFRPARVHGRAVRVLVNLPIDFKIRK